MKERLARIIAHECSGAETIWRSKLRVVDLLLDELEKPTPEMIAAIPDNYFSMYSTLDEIAQEKRGSPFWREQLFKLVVASVKAEQL